MSADTIAKAALARRSFIDYATTIYPNFDRDAAHVKYLCGLLERVERLELTRVIITAPPGHGKSTLMQAFTSWLLGRRRTRVLMISASQNLARRNSHIIRSQVTDEAYPWPTKSLEREALDEWETSTGSGVRAIGREGTVTGFRAELIAVDDVQADRMSPDTRQGLEDWFRGVLSTRLEPNGAIVLIQTRWGTDDLVARLIEGENGDDWVHINLQAICETENDPLERNIGEALWPKRWPVEAMLRKKSEVGSFEFESQYQGNPIPEGGLLFKKEWFANRFSSLPTHETMPFQGQFGLEQVTRPIWLPRVMALDTASKTGVANDWSVIAVMSADRRRNFFLEEILREKYEFPDLVRWVVRTYERVKPSVIYCEDASSGTALIQELRRATGLPIVPVRPEGSKESRWAAISGWCEAGRVQLPVSAPWIEPFLFEVTSAPGGRHDDQLDALTLAIDRLEHGIANAEWSSQFKQRTRGGIIASRMR